MFLVPYSYSRSDLFVISFFFFFESALQTNVVVSSVDPLVQLVGLLVELVMFSSRTRFVRLLNRHFSGICGNQLNLNTSVQAYDPTLHT